MRGSEEKCPRRFEGYVVTVLLKRKVDEEQRWNML
jgi:hypothetical protein